MQGDESSQDPFDITGKRFSHYLVGQRLGVGGMGMVYKARDEALNRLGQLRDLAAKLGLVLFHENERDIWGDVCEHVLVIAEQLRGDHFKLIFDFDNYNQCGEDVWANWQKLLEQDPLRFLAYNTDTIHPVRSGALHVITPHLLRELGLPAGKPGQSTATPCWKYLLHIMRTDNKNKGVTRQDYDAYWQKFFEMTDLDANGSLSAEEMRADSLLKAMDKNQSKTIELKEWLAAYAPLFQEYDRNNDGQLVLAEMAP